LSTHPGIDIPGTYVFDGEQSRRGYRLNKLCSSLRSAENRAEFQRDEDAYCEAYGLTADQKKAVLARDWSRMLDLGGNIFYVFKLAMLDHRSMQYLGGVFSGMSEEEFTAMMRAGGRVAGRAGGPGTGLTGRPGAGPAGGPGAGLAGGRGGSQAEGRCAGPAGSLPGVPGGAGDRPGG
jgi:protocatechuate 4,5-dioxygenase, alpha chain